MGKEAHRIGLQNWRKDLWEKNDDRCLKTLDMKPKRVSMADESAAVAANRNTPDATEGLANLSSINNVEPLTKNE